MPLVTLDPYSRRVIGCAIEVHRTLGPGLLEVVYEACLCRELDHAGLAYSRQQTLPVVYKGELIDCDLSLSVILCARHNRRQGGVSCRAKSGNWNAM